MFFFHILYLNWDLLNFEIIENFFLNQYCWSVHWNLPLQRIVTFCIFYNKNTYYDIITFHWKIWYFMGILRTAFDTSVVRHFICQSDSDVIGESHSKKPKDFLKRCLVCLKSTITYRSTQWGKSFMWHLQIDAKKWTFRMQLRII